MSVISNFVNNNQSLFSDVKQPTNAASTFASEFAEATQVERTPTPTTPKKSSRDIEREATEAQIKTFFDSMKNAGGASSYVQKMNQEKIDKLIKEKEDELKEAYGLNSKPPLSKEDTAKATQAVEEGLASFKKELLDKLKDQSKHEKTVQANSEVQAHSTSANGVKPKITNLAELLSAL